MMAPIRPACTGSITAAKTNTPPILSIRPACMRMPRMPLMWPAREGNPNMAEPKFERNEESVRALINALNDDLAREYQAIISYTIYSNVLTGAQWMKIADELKLHAAQELEHAMIIADQIDYLGGMPTGVPKEVKTSDQPEEMIRFDLDNETETIRNYRERVQQAEALGHYALAEQLRRIITQEQEHQHDLATALGIEVPKVISLGA